MPIEDAGSRPPIRFLDLDFSTLSFDEILAEVRQRATANGFSYIVTPNVDHVVRLFPKHPDHRTMAFRNAYDDAALRLCDSRILEKLAAMAGLKIPVVTGSDLTAALFRNVFSDKHRIAIIGGANDTIERLQKAFAGPVYIQHIPPMGVLNNQPAIDDTVRFLSNSDANVILFAIGAPQSEIIAQQLAQSASCGGVGLCIGASIDFLLGDQKRAPQWMQHSRLEWLFRLCAEPQRLWKRYLVDGPHILSVFMRWKRQADIVR